MSPRARRHLLPLLHSAFISPTAPSLPVDDDLWMHADADDEESWAAVRDEVLRGFDKHTDDDGVTWITHPLTRDHVAALTESREKRSAAGKAGRAAQLAAKPNDGAVTGIAVEDYWDVEEDIFRPEFHAANKFLGDLHRLRFGNASGELVIAELAPMISEMQRIGEDPGTQEVFDWLRDSPKADWYRNEQFANCKTLTSLVASAIKRWPDIVRDSKKGQAKNGQARRPRVEPPIIAPEPPEEWEPDPVEVWD